MAAIISWFISIVGSFAMLVLMETASDTMIGVLVLIAKFGVSSAYNLCFIGGSTLFPAIYTGMAMGYSVLMANLITILAPEVAEISGTWPMVFFFVICLIAIVASSCFKKHN